MVRLSNRNPPPAPKPPTEKQTRHQFQPGNKEGAKRRGPNRLTRDLKRGIIDAAILIGEDGRGKNGLIGYLKFLARKHPKCYVQLLGRLLPLQLGDTELGFIAAVNIVQVPCDKYYSPEEVARMIDPPALELVVNNDEPDEQA